MLGGLRCSDRDRQSQEQADASLSISICFEKCLSLSMRGAAANANQFGKVPTYCRRLLPKATRCTKAESGYEHCTVSHLFTSADKINSTLSEVIRPKKQWGQAAGLLQPQTISMGYLLQPRRSGLLCETYFPHEAVEHHLSLAHEGGSPGRIRTADPMVNSHLLCQLSYRGMSVQVYHKRLARIKKKGTTAIGQPESRELSLSVPCPH